jgi:hypothetical protein
VFYIGIIWRLIASVTTWTVAARWPGAAKAPDVCGATLPSPGTRPATLRATGVPVFSARVESVGPDAEGPHLSLLRPGDVIGNAIDETPAGYQQLAGFQRLDGGDLVGPE